MTHTPGPWEAQQACIGEHWHVWAPAVGYCPLVADVYGDGTFKTPPENNALLIAAAPELLAALDDTLWQLTRIEAMQGYQECQAEFWLAPVLDVIRRRVSEAIAKARGEK